MNGQKTLKPLSTLFRNKAEKEYNDVCERFTNHLHHSLSQYVNEHQDGSKHSTLSLLVAILDENSASCNSAKDIRSAEDNVNTDCMEVKEQSLFIKKYDSSLPINASSLCEKIFSLLLEGYQWDLALKVEEEVFLVHQHILCARSSYFDAMFQVEHRWAEAANRHITLGGITAEAFSVYLCHLYGAFINCPDFQASQLHDLALIADMFGSDDFRDVVQVFIQRDLCHFFHKPCSGCLATMSEAIKISHKFPMDKLCRKCLKWNSKHFVRLWPTKAFSVLPHSIQNECYFAVIQSLNTQTVINIALETDGLLGHLSPVKWASSVIELANRLMTVCLDYISEHICELVGIKSFLDLFRGINLRRDIVKEICEKIAAKLTTQNACSRYMAIEKLLDVAAKEEWNSTVLKPLEYMDKCTSDYMTTNYFAVIHTKDWELVPQQSRQQLQANTLCQGDPFRKPRHKPILSSSKHGHETNTNAALSSKKNARSTIKGKLKKPQACLKKTLRKPPNSSADRCAVVHHAVTDSTGMENETENNGSDKELEVLFYDIKPIIVRQELISGHVFEIPSTVFYSYTVETVTKQNAESVFSTI
ncbi:unnamed protein product [Clavelina lepadiformis]|uniref:BTB domain-containing protein n=1 Tax=Clavelina lepadiformis TaxID=159417 RepID=A0ABP0F517_CLALP